MTQSTNQVFARIPGESIEFLSTGNGHPMAIPVLAEYFLQVGRPAGTVGDDRAGEPGPQDQMPRKRFKNEMTDCSNWITGHFRQWHGEELPVELAGDPFSSFICRLGAGN